MTEADVRNAAMSKETEDEFRKMTYIQRVFPFVSIARNMYSVCNLDFKTWKKKTGLFPLREWHTQWSWADWRDQDRRHCRVRGGCTYGDKSWYSSRMRTQRLWHWSRSCRRHVRRQNFRPLLRSARSDHQILECDKKVGVNDEIRFSENHDEPCPEPGRKRQESA